MTVLPSILALDLQTLLCRRAHRRHSRSSDVARASATSKNCHDQLFIALRLTKVSNCVGTVYIAYLQIE